VLEGASVKSKFVLSFLIGTLAMSVPALSKTQLSFNAKDGTRLYAEYYPAENAKAILLVVHGLQSHSGWYLGGASNAEKGISSFAFDRRGSGLSAGAHGHVDSVGDFMDDFGSALEFVRSRNRQQLPIHVMANSLGSVIALKYFAENKSVKVDSLILTTPGTYSTPEGDYSLLSKLTILTSPSKRYFRSPIRDEHFAEEGNYLDWIVGDPMSRRHFTASFLRAVTLMKTKIEDRTAAIDIPMFALMASGDEIIDNKSFEEKIFSPYKSEKLIKYYDSKHYLFFGKDRELVSEDIQNWILGTES